MKSKTVFVCTNCGNESPKWSGRCTACGQWNTMEEYTPSPAVKTSAQRGSVRISDARPKRLSEIKTDEALRFTTGMGELDRVLGGGAVRGSLVLVGGAPVAGNARLDLHAAPALVQMQRKVNAVDHHRMAHGDQLTGFLRSHNTRHLRHCQHIALTDSTGLDLFHGGPCHIYSRCGACHAVRLCLFADVHHAGAALFVEMCQLHSPSSSYFKHITPRLRSAGLIYVVTLRLCENTAADSLLQ